MQKEYWYYHNYFSKISCGYSVSGTLAQLLFFILSYVYPHIFMSNPKFVEVEWYLGLVYEMWLENTMNV